MDRSEGPHGKIEFTFRTALLVSVRSVFYLCLILGGLCYLFARLATLVIAMMELRALPLAAYQTVYWTTFLPHV
jgi:hypothetical protein